MARIGLDGKMQAHVRHPRACILPSSPPYHARFYTSMLNPVAWSDVPPVHCFKNKHFEIV